mmetsp:Transcript_110194/g.310776  ORF Transcript_110194/g.310776 Transcript_110194/m.310776 type:complete len:82 (-) Transcript_110194:528-773(-)
MRHWSRRSNNNDWNLSRAQQVRLGGIVVCMTSRGAVFLRSVGVNFVEKTPQLGSESSKMERLGRGRNSMGAGCCRGGQPGS